MKNLPLRGNGHHYLLQVWRFRRSSEGGGGGEGESIFLFKNGNSREKGVGAYVKFPT